MYENFSLENSHFSKMIGGVRVDAMWMFGSNKWDNFAQFSICGCSFTFHADDFDSLRAAFQAARDMLAGKSPEEFNPMLIVQSDRPGFYTVRPEYVEVQ